MLSLFLATRRDWASVRIAPGSSRAKIAVAPKLELPCQASQTTELWRVQLRGESLRLPAQLALVSFGGLFVNQIRHVGARANQVAIAKHIVDAADGGPVLEVSQAGSRVGSLLTGIRSIPIVRH